MNKKNTTLAFLDLMRRFRRMRYVLRRTMNDKYARVIQCLILMQAGSAQAALFMGLGDLPGGPFESKVTDISSDGSVVVGESAVDTYERTPGDERPLLQAFRWTRDNRMQGLGRLSDPELPVSVASGVSSDGSVIVGESQSLSDPFDVDRSAAFRWTEATGMVAVPLVDSPPCSDFGITGFDRPDVSDDGTTVVAGSPGPDVPGFGCVVQPMRFTDDDGPIGLGFDAGDSGQATAVSADGSVVAGSSRTLFEPVIGTAWLWHEDTQSFTDLGVNGFRFVAALDMTPNASHVIGFGFGSGNGRRPFVWTKETGAVVLDFVGSPYGITDDGKMIIGAGPRIDNTLSHSLFVWTEYTGRRELVDVLTDDFGLGEQIAGWELGYFTLIATVSGDGRAIAGSGLNPDGNPEGWVAFFDRPIHWIPGDVDHDFDVDFEDFVRLADKFGQPGVWEDGDFDLNGTVEFPDFLALADNFGIQPVAATSAVPEPSAASLLGLAILAFVRAARRRIGL